MDCALELRCAWLMALLCATASADAQPVADNARQDAITDPAAAEVLALERSIGDAVVRGDAAYFDRVTSADFVMVHGDAWTRGGEPALVDDKASFTKRITNKSYAVLDYEVQAAEMHGDVAITYGRYVGHIPSSPEGQRWFYVWYQKVYAKRDGRWLYLSHRTVDGAHYGIDRASLAKL